MEPDAVERVAEHDRAPWLRIEEWLDAEMIAGAEQAPLGAIPDRECEVADQMRPAVFAPRAIGAQDQLRIGGGRARPLVPCEERGHEIVSRVDSRIGHDQAPPIKGERLLVGGAVFDNLQQGVPEPDIPDGVHALPIPAAKAEILGHPGKQTAVDRRSVQVQDAGNAAHSARGVSAAAVSISCWPSSRSMNSSRSARNRAGSTSYSSSSRSYASCTEDAPASAVHIRVPTALRPR